jgi:hypothetical protein
MKKYFYSDGTNKHGPYSKDELLFQKITRNTKIWYLGIDKWTELSSIPEFDTFVLSIPPEIKNIKINKQNDVIEKPLNKNHFSLTVNKIAFKKISIFTILIFVLLVGVIYFKYQNKSNIKKDIIENSYLGDEDFNIYIDKYYRDLEYYGIFPKKPKTLIVKFSKLDQLDNTTHLHGISYGYNDDEKIEIYINPTSWAKFSKPMKYFLMYHELSHDLLNLEDLDKGLVNEGRLMYPSLYSYENKNMDDFIESFQTLFEEEAKKRK